MIDESQKIIRLKKHLEDVERKVVDRKKLRKMFAHELEGPLNSSGATLNRIIKNIENGKEINPEHYKNLLNWNNQIKNLTGLLYLDGCSKEELMQDSKIIYPTDIAEDYARIHLKNMHDFNIRLRLKYDFPGEGKMQIYENEAILRAIMGTIIGDSIGWTPESEKATQGIRQTQKKQLQILVENPFNPQHKGPERKIAGMNRQIGTTFIKEIVETLGGEYKQYKKPKIPKDYDFVGTYGPEKKDCEKAEYPIFGTEILIPIRGIPKS